MRKEYNEALNNASAMAFIHVLHRNRDATFGDAGKLAVELGLEHLTVGQCFGSKLPSDEKEWSKLIGRRPRHKALAAAKVEDNSDLGKKIVGALSKCAKHGVAWSSWMTTERLASATGAELNALRSKLDKMVDDGRLHARENREGVIRYKLCTEK